MHLITSHTPPPRLRSAPRLTWTTKASKLSLTSPTNNVLTTCIDIVISRTVHHCPPIISPCRWCSIHCVIEHAWQMTNTRYSLLSHWNVAILNFVFAMFCVVWRLQTRNPPSEDQQCSSFVTAESPQNCLRLLLLFIVEEKLPQLPPFEMFECPET